MIRGNLPSGYEGRLGVESYALGVDTAQKLWELSENLTGVTLGTAEVLSS